MYALLAVLCCVVLGVQGFFLGQLTRLPTTTRQRGPSSARRCRAPRLAVMPPGKPGGGAGSAAAGGDDNGAGFGGDGKNRITRAPLRITPNFQPQEKRRPKTVADDEDIAYGAFLTEESFDIAGEGERVVIPFCFVAVFGMQQCVHTAAAVAGINS